MLPSSIERLGRLFAPSRSRLVRLARSTRLGVLLLGPLALAPSAFAKEPSAGRCEAVRVKLEKELAEAERRPIPLRDPARVAWDEVNPDERGRRCERFAPLVKALNGAHVREVERGTLGDEPRRWAAVVRSEGPHGSGRFWDLTLAVRDGAATVGACLTTSTSAVRALPETTSAQAGTWRPLDGGRLVVWADLVAGDAEIETLVEPLVYRVEDARSVEGSPSPVAPREALQLRFDRASTLDGLRRFAALYAAAAHDPHDEWAALHRAAAAAYRALADGKPCAAND